MTSRALRSAWLLVAPGPNTRDFFNALAAREDSDVTVFYCAPTHDKWHGSLGGLDGHRHRVLPNLNPWPTRREMLQCNPEILREALDDYDVFVVAGCTYGTAVLAMLERCALGRPYAVWGEMINRSGRAWRRLAQRPTVHALVRRAEAVMTMGARGTASYVDIGVRSDRILRLPYTCELEPYLAIGGDSQRHRKRLVCTAQLIQRKRVDLVIDVFCELAKQFEDWDLALVGTGPLEQELARMLPPEMRRRVEFLGFVAKEQQPGVYADSDLFVLASEEDGWGMVIPEAMAAGLPVVASDAVESATDLLARGGGELVAAGNRGALLSALRRYMSDPELRRTASVAAKESAQRMGAPAVAELAASHLRRIVSWRSAT